MSDHRFITYEITTITKSKERKAYEFENKKLEQLQNRNGKIHRKNKNNIEDLNTDKYSINTAATHAKTALQR